MIAGVDEAGRGPVIGPMVMCILACKDQEELKKLGVADSKMLTPEQREKLAAQLESFEHEIISLPPEEIDAAVNGNEDNLNKLEARTTALLIHRLMERVPIEKVIVDSPAKDGAKYEQVVRAALDSLDAKPVELQCEIKADANYPVVGAASILAKVTRDAAIRQIAEQHGAVGSGYPSDPDTQQFLDKHWKEGHDFFRKSWQSYQRLKDAAGQSSLADYSEHKEDVSAFSALKEHGFTFQEPSNQYETIRMKKDKTTVIKYTTGKVVVQGPEKATVEELLEELRLGQ